MFSQVIARLALAAAFVLAGQAALLHPLTHVDQKGSLVHVPGKDKTPGKLCDALAALAACAPDATPQAFVVLEFTESFPVAYLRVPRPAEPPPFLSQGPPALL
ncbi:MAG TPA: hypothetical protein VF943_12115 [Burkholderiales bacterium]